MKTHRPATFEMLETRRLMSGEPPEGIDPDIYELNNSFAAATNLGTTNNASLSGLNINVISDVDYFKFTAASSGSVGVRIDFRHLSGDLKMTGYNSAQQQIAFSNSSTATSNLESFALNVTAGQVYYLKVTTVTGTSPDYSLTLQPLVAAFDWTMPARFGVQRDAWNLPIIPNTTDYVQPNPLTIGYTQYPQFGVRLDASSSFVAAPSVTYNWHIAGDLVVRDLSGGPVLNTDLPEGQYNVTLTANGSNGVQLTTNKSITVKDWLIVSIGDSYGGGEGNPHQAQQFDIFGFPTSGAKWAQSGDAGATAAHRRAHRSAYAGSAQAALDLETSDPKSSVTFVFLNHTGANMHSLLYGPQSSVDSSDFSTDPDQLSQLRSLVGPRQVDALVLSIGAVDAGVGEAARALLQLEPGSPGYSADLNNVWATAATRRNTLVTAGFSDLLWGLDRGGWIYNNVFVTEYPDPTHDASGNTASAVLGDIYNGQEIDQNELDGFRTNVLNPLGQALSKFAADRGWEYVTDISSAFTYHGYGDWFRTASDSVVMQGPLGNRNAISPDEKALTSGTFHPTAAGQQVYRNRLDAGFTQPNLITTYFALTPSAFLPGATDGYTLGVRNVSLTGYAPASSAWILISPDSTVDSTYDQPILEVSIPALAPGQFYVISGTLPVMSDPYRTATNTDWVAPVLDVRNTVAESNEYDNQPLGPSHVAAIHPEHDLNFVAPNFEFSGPNATVGTMNGKLGSDETVGAYDIDGYRFTAQAGQRIAFDIDSSLDTYVRLFPIIGNNIVTWGQMASNDNGRAPDEPQAQTGESYLDYTFQTAGEYVLVVSHVLNKDASPMTLAGRVAAPQGDYSLTIAPVDTTPAAVTSSVWDWDGPRQKLKLTFNKNVSQSLNVSDLILKNVTTNQIVPTASISMSYDLPTNSVTFTFASILTDGNYRATLPAGSVSDLSGNTLATDFNFDFFTLGGDANHDRAVNVADLGILATNWQATGKIFSQGDFNYDGRVDVADLGILATNWQSTLASSAPSASRMHLSHRDDLLEELQ